MGGGGLVLGHSWCWVGVLRQSQRPEGILVPWVWVPNQCRCPVDALGERGCPGWGFWVPVAKPVPGDGVLGWGRCPGSELVSRGEALGGCWCPL